MKTLTALALSRPEVAFTFARGGAELLALPAAPSALDRFVEVMGRGSLPGVLPVSFAYAGMRLDGAVSPPETTFASRTFQWLYVNGRAARDGSVAHAARLAAEEALLGERHPAWVLFVTCPPEKVDPNVHPQKSEVRFLEPSSVHSLVHRGLREALTEGKSATALPASVLSEPFARPASWGDAPPAATALAETLGLWDAAGAPGYAGADPRAWHPIRRTPRGRPRRPPRPSPRPPGTLRLLGQYRESYLVAEGADGLVLVDQHVAHERVRFERIRDRLEGQGLASQALLSPVTFEAAPEEADALSRADAVLSSAGFSVSELSGRLFVVSAAPADCAAEKVVPVLRDLLGRLSEAAETGGARERGERVEDEGRPRRLARLPRGHHREPPPRPRGGGPPPRPTSPPAATRGPAPTGAPSSSPSRTPKCSSASEGAPDDLGPRPLRSEARPHAAALRLPLHLLLPLRHRPEEGGGALRLLAAAGADAAVGLPDVPVPPRRGRCRSSSAPSRSTSSGARWKPSGGRREYTVFWLVATLGGSLSAWALGTPLVSDPFVVPISMLFAYAFLFPDTQFLVFFVIPVKVKWIAFFSAGVLGLAFFRDLFSFGAGPAFVRVLGAGAGFLYFWVRHHGRFKARKAAREAIVAVKTAGAVRQDEALEKRNRELFPRVEALRASERAGVGAPRRRGAPERADAPRRPRREHLQAGRFQGGQGRRLPEVRGLRRVLAPLPRRAARRDRREEARPVTAPGKLPPR